MSEELKKEMSKDDKNILTFTAGTTIFQENDKGGDIYLIEAGEVEIYRTFENTRVPLAEMKNGELIGLFTCLNDQPRTASAEAKTDVRFKVISHKKILQAIGDLPKWFLIILKEYSIRLHDIEDDYMKQCITVDEYKSKALTPVYDGRLFCTALNRLSRFCSVTVDNEEFVLVDKVYNLIAETLGMNVGRVKVLGQTFLDSGLLLKEVEQDKKKQVFQVEGVQQLTDFVQFIIKARDGKSKRMVETQWPNRAVKFGRSLAKYAQFKNLGSATEIKIRFGDLETDLEKVTGTAYCEESEEFLIDFLLMKRETTKNKHDDLIKYIPKTLGRTVANVVCYQRLGRLDYKKELKKMGLEYETGSS
ncbi:MAG: hypothetical protein CMP10_19490 [Zetaproteobacteria bacterium]|nr:hypothetical protein [Pseudobdellovibrionaceae bacterium]